MAKWSDMQMIKFIQLYEENPCLWQADSVEYKNREMRQSALQKIVDAMDIANFDVKECKNKIKNVRSHYCQELKKIKTSKKSASGTDEVYKPSLAWFDLLDGFLRRIVQQKTESIIVTNTDESTEDTQMTNEDTQITNNVIDTSSSFAARNYVSGQRKKTPKRKIEDNNVFLSSALDRLETISTTGQTSTKNKTEFDIFGESVGMQLNNMSIEDALEIQLQMQQLLTQHRLKKLKASTLVADQQPSNWQHSNYSIGGCSRNLYTEDSDSSTDFNFDDTQNIIYKEDPDQETVGNPPEIPSQSLEKVEQSSDEVEQNPEEVTPRKRGHSFASPQTTKKSKPTAIDTREGSFEMMNSVCDTRNAKDDFEVFGDLVGRKIRSLPTKYVQDKVQNLIHNILFDAELGAYEPTPTLKYEVSPSASITD